MALPPTHISALPEYVSERFKFDLFDRATTDESEWYGPLNTLLSYLFPPEEYEVAPQRQPIHNYPGSDPVDAEWTALYIIHFISRVKAQTTKHPICVVGFKPAGHLHDPAARAAAEHQMRGARFEHRQIDSGGVGGLVTSVPKRGVFGISFIGSRFAVYKFDLGASRRVGPAGIDGVVGADLNEAAPDSDRWAHDFLDAGDGERKLLEVVGMIRGMC